MVSRETHRHAAELFDAEDFAGDNRLKAGYALMKTKDLGHAADFFGLRLAKTAEP